MHGRIGTLSILVGALILFSGALGAVRLVPGEYATIQAAIDDANEGDTVIIAEGTYTGIGNYNLDFGGKAITVQSADPEDPCVVATTVIDCEDISGRRGFHFHSGEEGNSTVSGLTIKGGKITGNAAKGGGIFCEGSSPTIRNCTIYSNKVYGVNGFGHSSYGGGISCNSSSNPVIANCFISNNEAQGSSSETDVGGYGYGGGIHCSSNSNATIKHCRIVNNKVSGGDGGIDMVSEPQGGYFIGFGGGSAYGGGIYAHSGIVIHNCIIRNNSAIGGDGGNGDSDGWGGAGLGAGIYSASAENCTVVNNSATGGWGDPPGSSCGGISGSGAIMNCIIWGNGPGGISGSPTISYSNMEGGYVGTGNIEADPCFADPCGGDYHLQSAAGRWDRNSESWLTDANTSVAIDAGDPNSDWTGELWPHGKRINMGAYGNTPEASMSLSSVGNIANLDDDVNDIVDGIDLGLFVERWCYEEPLLAEDMDRDGLVNFVDFAIFAAECSGVTVRETSISYQIEDCDMGAKAAVESGETRFSATVVGSYIHFEDMMVANCCPDELLLEMDVDGNVITIYEREVLVMPCFCICDYPVTATLGPFEAGAYTLEVYEDYGGFIGSTIVTIGQ